MDKHNQPSSQDQIVREERLEVVLLGRLVLELENISAKDDKIILLLQQLVDQGSGSDIAQSATLSITDTKGQSMNQVLQVGQTATALLHEWSGPSGTGTEVKPIGPLTYTSDDPTVATVDANSGLVTAIAPSKLDASGNPIPVTITGIDAGNGLSASDTVTDAPLPPPVAVSATIVITPTVAPAPVAASKPSGGGVSFP